MTTKVRHDTMDPDIGHLWAVAAVVISTLLAFLIGALIGLAFEQFWALGGAFAMAWIGAFYGAALYRGSVRKQEFIVIERMLKFWEVKFSGFHLAFPFIDRVRLRESFLAKDVELYVDDNDPEKRVEIDFTDASAPVNASAWYQIANPEDIRTGNEANMIKDILRYTYTVEEKDREERICEIFEGALRPKLQQQTIDEAQQKASTIIDTASRNVGNDLAELGVYATKGKSIIIRDIEIPKEILELRELELKGKKRAAEIANTSQGYWKSIQEIIDGAKAGGATITVNKAQQIFERQRAFDVIQQTGSNVTFVAPSMEGVMKTITVGGTK